MTPAFAWSEAEEEEVKETTYRGSLCEQYFRDTKSPTHRASSQNKKQEIDDKSDNSVMSELANALNDLKDESSIIPQSS